VSLPEFSGLPTIFGEKIIPAGAPQPIKETAKTQRAQSSSAFSAFSPPRRLFSGQVCLPGNKERKMTKEEVEAKVAAGEAL
jgi:hypothetical protein